MALPAQGGHSPPYAQRCCPRRFIDGNAFSPAASLPRCLVASLPCCLAASPYLRRLVPFISIILVIFQLSHSVCDHSIVFLSIMRAVPSTTEVLPPMLP